MANGDPQHQRDNESRHEQHANDDRRWPGAMLELAIRLLARACGGSRCAICANCCTGGPPRSRLIATNRCWGATALYGCAAPRRVRSGCAGNCCRAAECGASGPTARRGTTRHVAAGVIAEVGLWLACDVLQFGAQFGTSRVTIARAQCEQAMNQRRKTVGERRPQASDVGWVAVQPGQRGVGIGFAQEWNAPGETFVEHETERVEIGAAIQFSPPHLLG